MEDINSLEFGLSYQPLTIQIEKNMENNFNVKSKPTWACLVVKKIQQVIQTIIFHNMKHPECLQIELQSIN